MKELAFTKEAIKRRYLDYIAKDTKIEELSDDMKNIIDVFAEAMADYCEDTKELLQNKVKSIQNFNGFEH